MKGQFITSWDDGGINDINLAMMLLKYNIPAIFYIPSNCELNEEQIEWLSQEFEIGGHTVSHHQDMKLLPREVIRSEIVDNKKWLEDITGKKVDSFCYPRGRFNEMVKEEVKKAGYLEARTVRVNNFSKPEDKLETETTLHLSYPWRKEYEGDDVFLLAREYVDKFSRGEIEYLHFWGHSNELAKYDLWDEVEDLFQYINNKLRSKDEINN